MTCCLFWGIMFYWNTIMATHLQLSVAIPLLHLEFELRLLSLLGRCTTTWAMTQHLLLLVYFSGRVSLFPGLTSEHNYTWDYRRVPLCLAFLLRWGLTNFLPGLVWNPDPLYLHLLSSWDYRHELFNNWPVSGCFYYAASELTEQ
jgi:hypothetical protein